MESKLLIHIQYLSPSTGLLTVPVPYLKVGFPVCNEEDKNRILRFQPIRWLKNNSPAANRWRWPNAI